VEKEFLIQNTFLLSDGNDRFLGLSDKNAKIYILFNTNHRSQLKGRFLDRLRNQLILKKNCL